MELPPNAVVAEARPAEAPTAHGKTSWWRRLQPVGFGSSIIQTPQAEARATSQAEACATIWICAVPGPGLLIVAALAALWTGAAFGRLAYLQLFRYSEYYSRAQHQQRLIVDVGASRAEIFDRNMNPLAMSVPVDSAFAVPSEIADPGHGGAADRQGAGRSGRRNRHAHCQLAFLRVDRAQTASRKSGSHRRDESARNLFSARRRAVLSRSANLPRTCSVTWTSTRKGLGGIEYSLDDSIRSKPGKMLILADAHRRWYDSSDKAPDTGTSVVLTLDEKIQYIAEKELAQAIQDTQAKAGTVIVENPNSGELLAVANWPTFNPNAAKDSPPDARVDRAASSLYEPGSVFKIVTLSAAIDQGITNPDEVIDCQNGAIYIAGHRIRDHKAYGTAHGFADSGEFERRRRDQDRLAPRRAQILRLHSRVRFRRSPPAWICRARAAGCCAASKIGRRFRSARFPWGRKSA